VSPQEHVVGGDDARESLNEHSDDVSDDVFVMALREPKAMQFQTVLVVFQARPELGDHRCEITG
jgi:hypothetical protein